MMRIVGATDFQRGFKKVIDEVAEGKVPYVVTRGSRPEAVLVPYDEYLRLRSLEEKEVVHELDRLLERNADRAAETAEKEVLRDVAEARREVRSSD